MKTFIKPKHLFIALVASVFLSFVRKEKEFKTFQFPQNQIPRIDGDFEDWDMVPSAYSIGLSELKNTRFGEGEELDPEDFDLNVKVGWVKGLNRLYFYIDAYDDYWDFCDRALRQDIFELVIDADSSGGPFIFKEKQDSNISKKEKWFTKAEGSHAQNYHIFTPAYNKDWAMPWGSPAWIKEFPYANNATAYNFTNGQKGRFQMEFYITPFDFASKDGSEKSVISTLKENQIIGLSWSMLDFDGKQCDSFMNLSHDFRMISNADFLCKFRLMPLEPSLQKPIEADWKFTFENKEQRIVQFYDNSVGNITRWHWDFGDGQTSNKKKPLHQYKNPGQWVVVLTVEGKAGKSSRSKVWDVVTE